MGALEAAELWCVSLCILLGSKEQANACKVSLQAKYFFSVYIRRRRAFLIVRSEKKKDKVQKVQCRQRDFCVFPFLLFKYPS